MVDPITEDPRPIEERELEERREHDDEKLIAALKENPFTGATGVWRQYLKRTVLSTMEYDIQQYAAEYGWADTFRALALAIDAYEDARRRG